METDKAVILAAGRGTRMQQPIGASTLTARQSEVAMSGVKALMPVGRPLIDYVLAGLAHAGYRQICLVVAPDHDELRAHCLGLSGRRIEVEFAIQKSPLGTANALAAAAAFVQSDPFLMINSDNYYPAGALIELRSVNGSAVAAFTPEGLSAGNVAPERIRNFAILSAGLNGALERVTEKPDPELIRPEPMLVGMNCWRFTPAIFEACRNIPLSRRGEYELTDAVTFAIERLNERFQVLIVNEPVLDLSTRADIPEVTRRLAGIEVDL